MELKERTISHRHRDHLRILSAPYPPPGRPAPARRFPGPLQCRERHRNHRLEESHQSTPNLSGKVLLTSSLGLSEPAHGGFLLRGGGWCCFMAQRLLQRALGCDLGALGSEVTRTRSRHCSGLSSGSILAFLFSCRQQEISVCSQKGAIRASGRRSPLLPAPRAKSTSQKRPVGESPTTLEAVPLWCCFTLSPSSPELQPAARGQAMWSKISQQKIL